MLAASQEVDDEDEDVLSQKNGFKQSIYRGATAEVWQMGPPSTKEHNDSTTPNNRFEIAVYLLAAPVQMFVRAKWRWPFLRM